MHLLQPSTNIQLSRKTPDALLKHALRVIRKGYGFPSIFNADAVVEEQLRQGKIARGCAGRRLQRLRGGRRLRQGGLHPHRLLQPAEGAGARAARRRRPADRRQLGPADRSRQTNSTTFDDLFRGYSSRSSGTSWTSRSRGNQIIERLYAREMPAPFLSVLIDDCIAKGRDYNAGGARYNNTLHPGRGHRQHHRQPGRHRQAGVRGRTR